VSELSLSVVRGGQRGVAGILFHDSLIRVAQAARNRYLASEWLAGIDRGPKGRFAQNKLDLVLNLLVPLKLNLRCKRQLQSS
jgi:hypothetical protein